MQVMHSNEPSPTRDRISPLLGHLRASHWRELATLAATDPTGGPLLVLVRRFAEAALAPGSRERMAALHAAAAMVPDLDRYRVVELIVGGDPASLASIAAALDRLLTYAVTDAFLLEYPKCGRTWLRLMIGRAAERALGRTLADPTDLALLGDLVPALPRIMVTHDDDPELKAVADISRDKGIYRGKRVLLQIRDPRDVVVSYFFHRTTRRHEAFPVPPFTGTLAQFVRHLQGGIPNIVAFYNAWAAGRGEPAGLLRIDYEDLIADPAAGLGEALGFLGLPSPGEAGIAAVVDACSFAKMQALEAEGRVDSRRLRVTDPANPESRKVRRGKVGGYRDYLSADDIAWINAYLAAHLDGWYGRYLEPPGPIA